MKYLPDTCVVSEFVRGEAGALRREPVFVTANGGELSHVHGGAPENRRET